MTRAGFSSSLGAIGKRMVLGLKILFRDKAVKWTPVLNLLFVFLWAFDIWSERLQYDAKNSSSATDPDKQKSPAAPFVPLSNAVLRLKFAAYFAILIGNSLNVGIHEFFSERKKKMRAFLFSMGMSKISYYGFYLLFATLNMVLYSGMQLYVMLRQVERVDLFAQMFGLLVLTALSTSFALMSFSFLFTTAQAALGVILSTMMLSAGAIGYFSDTNKLQKPTTIFPVFEFLDFLLGSCNPARTSGINLAKTFQVLVAQLLGYGVLFVAVENMSKNDYGFYGPGSLCRKKVRNSDDAEPEDRDSGLHHLPQNTELYENSNDLKLNTPDKSGNPQKPGVVLSISELKKSFGSNVVLQGLNFSVNQGDISCLLGANGAGKSTLFNIILENVEADDGDIWKSWGNSPISYCPQTDMGWDYVKVSEHMDFIQYIQKSLGKTTDEQANLYKKVVEVCEIEDHWQKFSTELSGGYKRRLTIAMALLVNPKVTLLDEPTTSLDMEVRNALMKGLYRIREELGTTILYTTHHLEDAENFSDQIILLSKGKISLDGSMEQLRQKFNTATLVVTELTETSLPELRNYFSSNFNQASSDFSQISETEAHIKFISQSESGEKLIGHIEYIEKSLQAEVSLRLVSLEEVYLMEGEPEYAENTGSIGKTNLLNCWGKLSPGEPGQQTAQSRPSPSFWKRVKSMLRKGRPPVTSSLPRRPERVHFVRPAHHYGLGSCNRCRCGLLGVSQAHLLRRRGQRRHCHQNRAGCVVIHRFRRTTDAGTTLLCIFHPSTRTRVEDVRISGKLLRVAVRLDPSPQHLRVHFSVGG